MSEYLDKIISFIKSDMNYLYLAGLAVFCFLLLIILIIKGGKQRQLRSKLTIVERIDELGHESDYENKMQKILELISSYVKGDGYYLYLHDLANNRYRLEKALFRGTGRRRDSGSKVEVGYGRIIAYEKEVYSPPIAFDNAQIPEEPSVVMDGRFTVLILPVIKNKGFISVSGKPAGKSAESKEVEYIIQKLQPVIREAADNKVKTEEVLKNDITLNEDPMLSRIMEIALLTVGADAGLFISIENDYCELKSISGVEPSAEEKIRGNIDQAMIVEKMAAMNSFEVIDQIHPAFSRMPEILRNEKILQYLIIKTEDGVFVAFYEKTPEKGYFIEYRTDFLKLLMARIDLISDSSKGGSADEKQYEALCDLIRKMDDEEPYSVGYSDLISRYAVIVAKETGLNQHERTNIEKAALLSNIGVIIVPESVLKKKGLYDEHEYEMVKQHAEYGAYITEIFTGNQVVADYIRYHHERIDGMGYPEGLAGDEIPFGARIIGAVQSFLSKIKGRNYRDPLPFEKIVSFISEEAGKSLDKTAVEALINWFRKKQEKQILTGKPLGSCWEMKCSSEDICQKCPAYLRKDRFCWEFPENNCQAHGNNSCETCYVYTEYMARNKKN